MHAGFELDHVFVWTEPGASAARRLVDAGLSEGSPNVHPGQGTANRRFFFHNAMLELLWVADETQARAEPTRATGLWERWRAHTAGGSPFGIALRPAAATPATALPFAGWRYRPAYLPNDLYILLADDPRPEEPFLFHLPFGRRPDAVDGAGRQPLEHATGCRELSALELTIKGPGTNSAALAALAATPRTRVVRGREHLLELRFDGARSGRAIDLRPQLALRLCW